MPQSSQRPVVETFFDETRTNTATFVVSDPAAGRCAIIDPVLDYDAPSGRTSTASADRVIEHVRGKGLTCDWILETHAHADHLSGAVYLKEQLGGVTAIGARITTVQDVFGDLFNAEAGFARDGSQFGRLFEDGDSFQIGGIEARVMHTPGHTPACLTYVIGDAAFCGDTLFMPDYGTARCDFPGGDARTLYNSIQKILALPDDTRIFVGHDYLPEGRKTYRVETSVADERRDNIHVGGNKTEDDFVAMREARDKGLAAPKLILPSIQVNIRAGHMPPAEDNGVSYLKIPVNRI